MVDIKKELKATEKISPLTIQEQLGQTAVLNLIKNIAETEFDELKKDKLFRENFLALFTSTLVNTNALEKNATKNPDRNKYVTISLLNKIRELRAYDT